MKETELIQLKHPVIISSVTVMLKLENGSLDDVNPDDTASIQENTTLSTLQFKNGESVSPSSINREAFVEYVGGEELDDNILVPVPEDRTLDPDTSYDNNDTKTRLLGAMCIGLCCCFVIIVVVIVTVLVVRKQRK